MLKTVIKRATRREAVAPALRKNTMENAATYPSLKDRGVLVTGGAMGIGGGVLLWPFGWKVADRREANPGWKLSVGCGVDQLR